MLDDAQWLDRPTAAAVQFAARRLTGPVGIFATQRTGERPDFGLPLVMADSDRFARLEVRGLDLAGLHRLLQERTGRSFPRPALARIEAVSGGNPFLALELIRSVGEGPTMAPSTRFPATIAELARIRVRGLDPLARDVLLAAAVLTSPTVELLRRAVDPVATMLLEQAEHRGIVELDGARVRFTHPLLASGVYAMASAPRRRAMHRRLAGAGLDAEEGARHLALV